MRALAEGKGDFKKYRKLLQEKFICVNVYCKAVKDEHEPRGPEGPYQFKDRSVPVLLFKRWNGETLIQQLGFTPDIKNGSKRAADHFGYAELRYGKKPKLALKHAGLATRFDPLYARAWALQDLAPAGNAAGDPAGRCQRRTPLLGSRTTVEAPVPGISCHVQRPGRRFARHQGEWA